MNNRQVEYICERVIECSKHIADAERELGELGYIIVETDGQSGIWGMMDCINEAAPYVITEKGSPCIPNAICYRQWKRLLEKT